MLSKEKNRRLMVKDMKKAVVVGGSNGIGLAVSNIISREYDSVVVFDIVEPLTSETKIIHKYCDISKDIKPILEEIKDADCLVITAGFGVVKPINNYSQPEIIKAMTVNALAPIQICGAFYSNLFSKKNIKCMVMGSISGEVSSPLFSIYGSAKAALCKFCESANIELEKNGYDNRITCVVATSLEGTSFNGEKTNLEKIMPIARDCVNAMNKAQDKFFVNEELCKRIINDYNQDRKQFGLSSYDYKVNSNRINLEKKNIVVGYLSGTFDLFHIGHLNLLRRAKKECDYLIVGIHKSGSWKGKQTFIPFEERVEIVKSCKYVDEVHESPDEDSDAWDVYHFDKLFVGSDYKGTERFNRYELFFKDKGVEIVYFPYTKTTNSTQIRELISESTKNKSK